LSRLQTSLYYVLKEEIIVNKLLNVVLSITALALTACATVATPPVAPTKPAAWGKPEALVAPSSFTGVHGLAIDQKGRLLAGSVVGNAIWEVDRTTGAAKVLIGGPEGQADDIAVGPKNELAWTNYLMGMVRYRENDAAPMRVLAKDLPGLNSLDFDRRNGKLYASQVFLGDALWELDVAGVAPPRLIAKDLGGLNGFEVGPDGMIYGPLWFKGQVVKVDPADGKITVINDQFKVPAAANLDGKGNLWVVDTKTGELSKVELASGRKTVMKQLATALDNLAIAPEGTIYISNMADNSVQAYNPATGDVKTLTSGKLAVPAGLRFADGALWVADVFSFRKVDAKSGQVTDLARMQNSDLEYPFGVGISKKLIALTSWFTSSLQVIDRATMKTITTVHGLKAPMDAIPMDDGSILFIEIAAGNLSRATGADFKTHTVVAAGLAGPVQMTLGRDGAVYVTEAAGKLTRVNLADGSKTTVAEGLALPEGVAQTPWGSFIVAETAAGRLTEIDATGGTRRVVAENLPIGLPGGPGMPPPYVPTGVAVGSDGTIYFSADRNNAIYRIAPQR
jgi:sugar lactone lactonase YvrE